MVPYAADLTTRSGKQATVDAALDQFGWLDLIVANAGRIGIRPARSPLTRQTTGRHLGCSWVARRCAATGHRCFLKSLRNLSNSGPTVPRRTQLAI